MLKPLSSYVSTKVPIIFTDAKTLLTIAKSKFDNLSTANMANFLAYHAQTTNFKILHIPGKFNYFSDLFSSSFTGSMPLNNHLQKMNNNYHKMNSPFSMDSETPSPNGSIRPRSRKSLSSFKL